MRWAIVEAAVAHYWANEPRYPQVTLTGGEPLTEWTLTKRVITQMTSAVRTGHPVALEVLTNGSLLDADRIAFLAAHDVSMQLGVDISLDLGASRRSDGLTSPLSVLELADEIAPSWFVSRVSVSITLTRNAIPSLASSVRRLVRTGARDIRVAPAIGIMNNIWNADDSETLEAQFAMLYGDAWSHYRETGRVPLTMFRKGTPTATGTAWRPCDVARPAQLVVDVNGDTFACAAAIGSVRRTASPGWVRTCEALQIGNVLDTHMLNRLEQYRRRLFTTALLEGPEGRRSGVRHCATCTERDECFVCPFALADSQSGNDVTPLVCEFNRLASTYRRRFPQQWDPVGIIRQMVERHRGAPSVGSE